MSSKIISLWSQNANVKPNTYIIILNIVMILCLDLGNQDVAKLKWRFNINGVLIAAIVCPTNM